MHPPTTTTIRSAVVRGLLSLFCVGAGFASAQAGLQFVPGPSGQFNVAVPVANGQPVGGVAKSHAVDFFATGRSDIVLAFGVYPPQPSQTLPLLILRPGPGGALSDVTRLLLGPGALPGTEAPREIVAGDFNGDGRLGLFFGDHGWDAPPFPGGKNVLLLPTQDGTLTDRSDALPQTLQFTHSAAVGDIDGDGLLDVYVGVLDRPPYFLMNQGTGAFKVATDRLPAGHVTSYAAVLLADVDGDGYPDLVLGGWPPGGGQSVVLFNDGRGGFARRAPYVLPGAFADDYNVQCIVALDVDRDGSPDLVLIATDYWGGSSLRVLINRRDGTFADETVQRMGAAAAGILPGKFSWLGTADLNGDGYLDLYANLGTNTQVGAAGVDMMWINNRNGTFTSVSSSILGTNVNVPIAIDVDGDGMQDFVVANDVGAGTLAYRTFLNKTPRTVPSEPVIGPAIAGNGQIDVAFSTPLSAGASAITGYMAICTGAAGAGVGTASGAASPITVTGLVNFLPYTCSVSATNGAGSSLPSASSNQVTPQGPVTVAVTGNGTSLYGADVALTATLSGGSAPTGTVKFRANGATIPGCAAVAVVAGVAACATAALPRGTHSITAAYSGDASNTAAISPVVLHSIPGGWLTASPLQFPRVAVRSFSRNNVSLTNVGDAPLDVHGVTFTGPLSLNRNGCQATLPEGASCNLTVDYSPTTTSGPIPGSVQVAHSGVNNPFVVTANGMGVAYAAPVLTGAFSPSTVVAGNASARLTLSMSNPNDTPFTSAMVGFNLPPGMVTTASPNAASDCDGAWSAAGWLGGGSPADRTSLEWRAETVPAKGTCAASIDVVSPAGPGIYTINATFSASQLLADFPEFSLAIASAAENFQGLWWNPAESGWGINFAHQGDIVFATWFTYDAAGKPWWLIAELHKSAARVYTGPVSTVAGPPFNAVPFAPAPVETQVGTMTATFSDATHGSLAYTVNGIAQTKAIVPQQFGPLPTCTWGAQSNLALATNYTDLWWNATESGWGVNFTHQGDIIFATWFTYDAAGKPWWLIAELHKGAGATYSGSVWTVSGQAFDTVPWNANTVVETVVGTASATFADGKAATFAYTVNGVSQSKPVTRQVFVPPGTVCQ